MEMEKPMHREVHTVLPKASGGGPHGLGDPDDKSLRKLERDVIIKKRMIKQCNDTECADATKAFIDCATAEQLKTPYRCKAIHTQLEECLVACLKKDETFNGVKEQYLEDRTYYRRNGYANEHAKHRK